MSEQPISIETMTYEQALVELEGITLRLEEESPALEEALGLFERGQALARHCASLLDQAELKVRRLSGEELSELGEEA